MPLAEDPRERQLAESWVANAAAWTTVVREGRIPSRRAGTDAAIVAAVEALAPRTVLDVGCGEGWLVRALARPGRMAVGVDLSAPLIEAARAAGGGRFEVVHHDELPARVATLGGPFDAIVCNFSLLGAELEAPLSSLRAVLAPGGALVIQTVHPWVAAGEGPYEAGWRLETFDAFGAPFAQPMPWYARTLAGWVGALAAAGWVVTGLEEPRHPESGEPLSLLLVAAPARGG